MKVEIIPLAAKQMHCTIMVPKIRLLKVVDPHNTTFIKSNGEILVSYCGRLPSADPFSPLATFTEWVLDPSDALSEGLLEVVKE